MYDQRGVTVGLVSTIALFTNPQDVAAYGDMFEKLEAMAVFDDEAREVFVRLADEYRTLE